jgi:hypothetical protein
MPDRGRGNPWRLEKNIAQLSSTFSTFTIQNTTNNAVSIPHAILHNLTSGSAQVGIGVGQRYYSWSAGGSNIAAETHVILDKVTSGLENSHYAFRPERDGALTTGLDVYPEGATGTAVHRTGGINGLLINYKDDDEVTITAGTCEANGKLYTLASDTDFDLGTLVADSLYYIYILGSSTAPTMTFQRSLVAPTWSASKMGWYNSTDRCIGSVWTDDSTLIVPFETLQISDHVICNRWARDTFSALGASMNPTNAWQTPNVAESSTVLPVNAIAGWFRMYNTDTGSLLSMSAASSEYADLETVISQGTFDVVAADAYGTFFKIPLGASRNIKIGGGDNDDNNLSLWGIGCDFSR